MCKLIVEKLEAAKAPIPDWLVEVANSATGGGGGGGSDAGAAAGGGDDDDEWG